MKRSFNFVFIFVPLLTLTGCNTVNFESSLDVFSPFQIKGTLKSITINSGKFDAKFVVKGKNKILIKTQGENAQTLKLSIPSSVVLPERNGQFFISANDLEQSFDLEGNIQTNFDNGPRTSIVENCFGKTGTRRVCHLEPGSVVCHDVNGNQVCTSTGMTEVCHTEDVFSPGTREVTFHEQTEQTSLELEFKNPDSDISIAQLKGKSDIHKTRIIESESACRLIAIRS